MKQINIVMKIQEKLKTAIKVLMKMNAREHLLCRWQNVHMFKENIMLKICAHLAIESLEEIKMHLSVVIMIGFSIPWECVKHAIYLIITKEELRLRENRLLLWSKRNQLKRFLKRIIIKTNVLIKTFKKIKRKWWFLHFYLNLVNYSQMMMIQAFNKNELLYEFWSWN